MAENKARLVRSRPLQSWLRGLQLLRVVKCEPPNKYRTRMVNLKHQGPRNNSRPRRYSFSDPGQVQPAACWQKIDLLDLHAKRVPLRKDKGS